MTEEDNNNNNVTLVDVEAIDSLQQEINIELQRISKYQSKSNGFVVDQDFIIELQLQNLNLSKFPESLSKFKYLNRLKLNQNQFGRINISNIRGI